MNDRFYLVDEEHGIAWFHLGNVSGTPYIGELPLEPGRQGQGWWYTAVSKDAVLAVPPEIEILRSPGRRVTRYALALKVEAHRPNGAPYPETITPGEYFARVDEDSDLYDRRVAALYDAVYEDVPPVREPVEGKWLHLEGAPPPKDGLNWAAKLPYTLANRPEYLHLFPGHLAGFREHVAAALQELPGVKAYTNRPGPVTVYLEVTLPKPEPVVWMAPPALAGLNRAERKRAVERHKASETRITRQLNVSVPGQIDGENRAAAVAAWDEQMEAVVGTIRTMIAQPCPACKGHGWVEP